jgi:hypothetical protein
MRDSMHSSIERQLRKLGIQVPSDYVQIIINACQVPQPYIALSISGLQFLKRFNEKSAMVYLSIRRGNKVGDPSATDK